MRGILAKRTLLAAHGRLHRVRTFPERLIPAFNEPSSDAPTTTASTG